MYFLFKYFIYFNYVPIVTKIAKNKKMTNIIRAVINQIRLEKLVRTTNNVTPVLVFEREKDGFETKEGNCANKKDALSKYYARGHLIIPSEMIARMGQPSLLSGRYGGLIKNWAVTRDENIEGLDNFAVCLGKSEIYIGFQEITLGICKLADTRNEKIVDSLGAYDVLMPQICEWYAEFFKNKK